jgi:hypothetical protein
VKRAGPANDGKAKHFVDPVNGSNRWQQLNRYAACR